MKRRMTLLAVALLGVSVSAAQSPVNTHEEAAQELLTVMDLERTMLGGASAMTDAMIQGQPILAPYRDVMVQWASEIMTWETFGPKFIALYTETFTESELREMIAFYRTPTGQKALALMPELMQRGAKMGAEVAQEHIPELEEAIKRRAAELEELSAQP